MVDVSQHVLIGSVTVGHFEDTYLFSYRAVIHDDGVMVDVGNDAVSRNGHTWFLTVAPHHVKESARKQVNEFVEMVLLGSGRITESPKEESDNG